MSDELIKFSIFTVVALVLLKIPVIGKYVSLINTLIHEVGHALMAMLTGGRVAKIELFANTEGTAWASHRFYLGGVMTSLAGYPVASATAFLFVYFSVTNQVQFILLGLLGVLAVSAVFWIRNLYGMLWVFTFGAALTYLLWLGNPVISANIALFITSIVFIASITTAFDILKLSVKTPRDAGDASNLARSALLPAPIWGLLFFTQSLAFAYFGIRLVFAA